MVKRYTPTAMISYACYDDNSDEPIISIDKDPKGKFVKYEAYRSLEAKYNKFVYGADCLCISKATKLSPKEVQNRVRKFCSTHYLDFNYYPTQMDITNNVTINLTTMMAIISYGET